MYCTAKLLTKVVERSPCSPLLSLLSLCFLSFAPGLCPLHHEPFLFQPGSCPLHLDHVLCDWIHVIYVLCILQFPLPTRDHVLCMPVHVLCYEYLVHVLCRLTSRLTSENSDSIPMKASRGFPKPSSKHMLSFSQQRVNVLLQHLGSFGRLTLMCIHAR